MSTTPGRPAFIPSVIYKDNRAALAWLQKAFGFEVSELLVDSKDNIMHAEMSYRDGIVTIGNEWAEWTRSPASAHAGNTPSNTQFVRVRLEKGIDEHCSRARDAGAKIVREPADQFYGDRTYMAQDLEGHH